MEDCGQEYFCVQLTREELNEIAIALQARIGNLKKALAEVHTLEAKEAIGRTLQACISAQTETAWAEQAEACVYRAEAMAYQQGDRPPEDC